MSCLSCVQPDCFIQNLPKLKDFCLVLFCFGMNGSACISENSLLTAELEKMRPHWANYFFAKFRSSSRKNLWIHFWGNLIPGSNDHGGRKQLKIRIFIGGLCWINNVTLKEICSGSGCWSVVHHTVLNVQIRVLNPSARHTMFKRMKTLTFRRPNRQEGILGWTFCIRQVLNEAGDWTFVRHSVFLQKGNLPFRHNYNTVKHWLLFWLTDVGLDVACFTWHILWSVFCGWEEKNAPNHEEQKSKRVLDICKMQKHLTEQRAQKQKQQDTAPPGLPAWPVACHPTPTTHHPPPTT